MALVAVITDALPPSPDGNWYRYFWPMDQYIKGAVALGASLRSQLTRPVEQLLLVREGLALPTNASARLAAVGWRVGTIPTITPPHQPGTVRFRHQFSKLALWNMTQYDRILYMDTDTLAVGNLDFLFDVAMPEGQHLAAAKDFNYGRWQQSFNMGVAVIQPAAKEYQRLLHLLQEDKVKYNWNWAEQGFLGKVYAKFTELPFEANGNTVCEHQAPAFWKVHLPALRVVHFTMRKPWQCANTKAIYCGQLDVWRKALRHGEQLARSQQKVHA